MQILSGTLASVAASRANGQMHPASSSAVANWKPEFFSIEQNDTLVALGERIVPGSAQALCNRLIDSVMRIESEKNRRELVDSLEWFNHESERRHQQPFPALPANSQDEILASACESKDKPQHEFQLVKEWVADAYWSSQDGLRELGSTGKMAWKEFPNCPDQHSHN